MLFISMTLLCGTDNIPHNQTEPGDIMQNIVSPTEHCYGYEYCYVETPYTLYI